MTRGLPSLADATRFTPCIPHALTRVNRPVLCRILAARRMVNHESTAATLTESSHSNPSTLRESPAQKIARLRASAQLSRTASKAAHLSPNFRAAYPHLRPTPAPSATSSQSFDPTSSFRTSDRVLQYGRIWADRLHRFVAYSLVGFTGLAFLLVAAGSIELLVKRARRSRSLSSLPSPPSPIP